MVDIWLRIVTDKEFKKYMVKKISETLSRITGTGGILLIAQYESYFERMMDMKNITKYCAGMFSEVTEFLTEKEFIKVVVSDKAFFPESHFGPEHQVVLRRK